MAAAASLTDPVAVLHAQTPTAHAHHRLLVAPTYLLADAVAVHRLAATLIADARLRQETDTASQEVVIATGLGLAPRLRL